jgi:hypothetical protein
MKISGITDSRGQVHPVPAYKPNGLLKDSKVERLTPKSEFLRKLEEKQKRPKSAVIEFASKR